MLVTETFHGYVETTQDVLLIFEGCRRGLLPRICRRLQEKERKMIRSGSVFVFDERESGIKRWTDGLVWSPSRILGNFLIYRELDKRNSGGSSKRLSVSSPGNSSYDARQRSFSADHGSASSTIAAAGGVMSMDRNRERQLVGSLSDSYKFRKDGLIKKTMSIVVNGVAQHLISYYHPQDVLQNRLRTPSSVPELASLEISPELLIKQNFRIPPMIEPTMDHSHPAGNSPLSPTIAGFNDRRAHPLRSMSLGSLRTPEQHYHHHHQGNMMGRPDMNTTSFMYAYNAHPHPHQQQQQNAAADGSQKPSPPMASYQPPPVMYGVHGYAPAMPSPSSMSSSPGTPMMSPVRPSFSHQQQQQQQQQQQHTRHYSISSTSSGSFPSIPRLDTSYSSIPHHRQDRPPTYLQQQQPPQLSPRPQNHHGAYMPAVGQEDLDFYSRSQSKQQQDIQEPADRAAIGQLLNPVHPLNAAAPAQETESSHPHESFVQPFSGQQPSTSFAEYSCSIDAVSAAAAAAAAAAVSHPFAVKSEPTKPNNEQQQQERQQQQQQHDAGSGDSSSGGGGGGGGGGTSSSSLSEYRHEAMANTYSFMHHLPPPFQNGALGPYGGGQHEDSQLMAAAGSDFGGGGGPLMLK